MGYPIHKCLLRRHCEGLRPVSTAQVTTPVAPPVITTTAAASDEHTDAPGTADPGPSPTESIGCERHGDHWHCDGPVNTLSMYFYLYFSSQRSLSG